MKRFFFSLIFIFIILNISAQAPTMQIIMPDKAVSGKSFNVKVFINKLDLRVFAQYKISLPDDFYLIPTQTGSSELTQKGNISSFVWEETPADDTISLSFEIQVPQGIRGIAYLKSKFSYNIYNKVGNIFDTKKIYILSSDTDKIELINQNNQTGEQPQNKELFVVTRKVEKIKDKQVYNVEIKLSGTEKITSNAVLSEQIPSGFIFRPINVYGAEISYNNDTINFYWSKINYPTPQKNNKKTKKTKSKNKTKTKQNKKYETIIVNYQLIPRESNNQLPYQWTGIFKFKNKDKTENIIVKRLENNKK